MGRLVLAAKVTHVPSLMLSELEGGRQHGRYREFLNMLPDYATRCSGEGGMADTIMLFAALGWYDYRGAAEQLCDYFPSSGSGQVNVEFHLDV